MRILIVTGFFPPYAPTSATRMPAFARYLLEEGHDVRVLGSRSTLIKHTLDHRLPPERVRYAPVIEAREAAPRDQATRKREMYHWALRLKSMALAAIGIPDPRCGWIPYGTEAGRRFVVDWKPDAIIASVPPHSGLFVAARLARELGSKFVIDFRDLWVDHPYYEARGLRWHLESFLEDRVLRAADGYVTVTDGWAAHLRRRHGKPVRCVMNGYDAKDYADPPKSPGPQGPLTLIYGGGLYGNKRDPRPLFAAIASLGWGPEDISVQFHVDAPKKIRAWAVDYGVADCIDTSGFVTRPELLTKQMKSDLLLLLRWDNPSEDHVIAGKLFEYIGCRRPILSVGRTSGEAAAIIRDEGFGAVENDPNEIARALEQWLSEKRSAGIPAPTKGIPEKFSRNSQFRLFVEFLEELS